MSSLVTAGVRSVSGKIPRSGLDTRRSRPPASTIVSLAGAMPTSSTPRRAHLPRMHDRHLGPALGDPLGCQPALVFLDAYSARIAPVYETEEIVETERRADLQLV